MSDAPLAVAGNLVLSRNKYRTDKSRVGDESLVRSDRLWMNSSSGGSDLDFSVVVQGKRVWVVKCIKS